MFNSMINKVITPKSTDLVNPTTLVFDVEEGEKLKTYNLLKGGEDYLYKRLGLKPNTSKEVYKKCENIWMNLRDFLLRDVGDKPNPHDRFSLTDSDLIYLCDDYGNVVDIKNVRTEENVENFKQKLENFILDITTMEKTRKFYDESNDGLVKLICYDKDSDLTNEDFTPIVMLEYNSRKSNYIVYTGILIYKNFSFIPALTSYMEYNSAILLISSLDISTILEESKENAQELYDTYTAFCQNPVEISARELISLLKKVGYKLELAEDDTLSPIENIMDEQSSEKIVNFFNTFKFSTGESALDILTLSELKKMFRYNKLTLVDVLNILSKEYLSSSGSKITVKVLSGLYYDMLDRHTDQKQIKSLATDININVTKE